MKKIIILLFLLSSCINLNIPKAFIYKEIKTNTYTFATWQKITDNISPIRIYIEGDGHAFNYAGQPTSNPTPKGTFLRKIAFNDPNPNVIYLARPCQYVEDSVCTQKDWTTGRFSKEIVQSASEAIKTLIGDKQIILIGYSGGALLSGLIIQENPHLNIQKWITIAGLLNHTKWTEKSHLQPLTDSIDLEQLPTVLQKHFIGEKDKIIPIDLYINHVPKGSLIIVKNATHDTGYEEIYSKIYY